MKTVLSFWFMSALLLACVAIPAMAQDPRADDYLAMQMAKAKQLFDRLVSLEKECDPTLADLYSDEASIVNAQRREDGFTQPFSTSAQSYKEFIRKRMPVAKKLGDRLTYTNAQFSAEGENVQIKAVRVSERSKVETPVTFLVGPVDKGEWKILKELMQTVTPAPSPGLIKPLELPSAPPVEPKK